MFTFTFILNQPIFLTLLKFNNMKNTNKPVIINKPRLICKLLFSLLFCLLFFAAQKKTCAQGMTLDLSPAWYDMKIYPHRHPAME